MTAAIPDSFACHRLNLPLDCLVKRLRVNDATLRIAPVDGTVRYGASEEIPNAIRLGAYAKDPVVTSYRRTLRIIDVLDRHM